MINILCLISYVWGCLRKTRTGEDTIGKIVGFLWKATAILQTPSWTSLRGLCRWSWKIVVMQMAHSAAVIMMKIKILAWTRLCPSVSATSMLLIRLQRNYIAATDQYLKITESQTLLKRIRKHIRNLISMIWKTKNSTTKSTKTTNNSSTRSTSSSWADKRVWGLASPSLISNSLRTSEDSLAKSTLLHRVPHKWVKIIMGQILYNLIKKWISKSTRINKKMDAQIWKIQILFITTMAFTNTWQESNESIHQAWMPLSVPRNNKSKRLKSTKRCMMSPTRWTPTCFNNNKASTQLHGISLASISNTSGHCNHAQ